MNTIIAMTIGAAMVLLYWALVRSAAIARLGAPTTITLSDRGFVRMLRPGHILAVGTVGNTERMLVLGTHPPTATVLVRRLPG